MAKFITSSRGKRKLVDSENYVYDFHSASGRSFKEYWRCENRKTCGVRVTTCSQDSNKINILHRSKPHDHSSDVDVLESRIAVQEIKRTASIETSVPPRELIAREVCKLDSTAKASLPTLNVIRESVRCRRRKVNNLPINPISRCDFEIPVEYKTIEGSKFLQYDSGINEMNRILIFASEKALEDLTSATTWGCDGTFKIVPMQWHQLFCIHIFFKDTMFPRLFALLPNKNESTYDKFFTALSNLIPLSSPSVIVTDFEKAIHNAVRRAYPSVSVQGCHFHLGQALYRKISTLGFRERYNTDPSFSLKIRKLTALAFLPPNDVIEAYEDLIDDDDFSNDLITYFDVTYIGVAKGRADRRRRQNPIFPISVWNVRQRVLEDLPRTNNPLESFHHHFHSAAGGNHVNIWKLILQMKKEEAYQTTKMEHLRRGDSLKKNSKYSAINERLKNLVSTYDEGCEDKATFLENIAVNLHKF